MDWFWIIFIAIIGLGILTQIVQSRFKKTNLHYSQIPSTSRRTGAQVANEILARNNIRNVQVIIAKREGQDHYDPKRNHIMLSPSVYNSSSIAALAIAAHEAGHAIQWGKQEFGIKLRDTVAKPVMFVNRMTGFIFSMWLILLLFGYPLIIFVWAGLFTYASTTIFQLVTLPVEFGASSKAKTQLKDLGYIRTQEEEEGTKKVLTSAAMTYVMAFLSSMVMFALYLLLILSRRRR